jgi:hypothetical protein
MSSVPPYVSGPGSTRPAPKPDAGRLWTGGLATAAVAALVAVAGVLIARGVFDVPVLAPTGEGTLATPARPGWPAWPRSRPCWPPVCCTCCCCPRPARAGSSAGSSGWPP